MLVATGSGRPAKPRTGANLPSWHPWRWVMVMRHDEARKQSCKDSHPIPLAHPAYPGRCTACADMCLASAHSTNDGFGSPHSGNIGIGKWISHYRDTNFPYNACVALQMPSKLVLHFHVFPQINMGKMMENVYPIQLPMNFPVT